MLTVILKCIDSSGLLNVFSHENPNLFTYLSEL